MLNGRLNEQMCQKLNGLWLKKNKRTFKYRNNIHHTYSTLNRLRDDNDTGSLFISKVTRKKWGMCSVHCPAKCLQMCDYKLMRISSFINMGFHPFWWQPENMCVWIWFEIRLNTNIKFSASKVTLLSHILMSFFC